MARRLKKKKRKTLKQAAAGGGDSGKKFKIKAHFRTPRGANAGKKRVRVRRHRRKAGRHS